MKDIDADYYGYRDEDDGLIVPAEQEAERAGEEMGQSGARVQSGLACLCPLHWI